MGPGHCGGYCNLQCDRAPLPAPFVQTLASFANSLPWFLLHVHSCGSAIVIISYNTNRRSRESKTVMHHGTDRKPLHMYSLQVLGDARVLRPMSSYPYLRVLMPTRLPIVVDSTANRPETWEMCSFE